MLKPKSRNPATWPEKIISVFLAATRSEVLIPFENTERVRAFKGVLRDVRRSFREHNHPEFEAISALAIKPYKTIDIMAARPQFRTDAIRYPLTAIVSNALGYANNISEAAVITPTPQSTTPPPTHNDIIDALDLELMQLVESLPNDDENSIADIFNR